MLVSSAENQDSILQYQTWFVIETSDESRMFPTDNDPCLARVAHVARAALTERSGSSTKRRTPNIRYLVAKPSIVAIYSLFERLSQGF